MKIRAWFSDLFYRAGGFRFGQPKANGANHRDGEGSTGAAAWPKRPSHGRAIHRG